jgi:hypothetical protein
MAGTVVGSTLKCLDTQQHNSKQRYAFQEDPSDSVADKPVGAAGPALP